MENLETQGTNGGTMENVEKQSNKYNTKTENMSSIYSPKRQNTKTTPPPHQNKTNKNQKTGRTQKFAKEEQFIIIM